MEGYCVADGLCCWSACGGAAGAVSVISVAVAAAATDGTGTAVFTVAFNKERAGAGR